MTKAKHQVLVGQRIGDAVLNAHAKKKGIISTLTKRQFGISKEYATLIRNSFYDGTLRITSAEGRIVAFMQNNPDIDYGFLSAFAGNVEHRKYATALYRVNNGTPVVKKEVDGNCNKLTSLRFDKDKLKAFLYS